MKKHLYEIKRLDIPAYLKWWFIKKKFAGTLSEVMENLTSPITLTNGLKRKFKIFEIGGNSIQDGTPSPTNPVPIQNVGDNVNIYHIEDQEPFTINGIEWSVNNNIIHARGTATTDSSTRARIPFDMTGKVGTFSFKAKEGTYVYCRVEKNGSTTYPTSPITFDGTETLVQIYPQISRGVTVDTDISIKVEEGSTSTGYSPYNCGSVDVKVSNGTNITVEGYEEQTVTFPTAEGQVLHLGDTLEDDGVHQRKATKVLDGTENYTMSAVDNLNRFALYLINSVSSNTRISVISSHFRYASSGNAEGIIFLNHQNIYMYPETDITTVAEFKEFLAQQYANGTPVTLEYELAEPIIVPYTEAQQQVYDEIKALYSYKGTTYILSDNEPSPIFKIQYVKEE